MARKIEVEILGDSRSLERAFLRSSRAGSSWAGGIAKSGLVAGAAIAGFSVAAAKGIQAASNLSEQVNKSEVVFEENASAVLAWSKTTADALGLSQRAALEFAGTFGQMLQVAGVVPKQAAEMSTALVGLGADLASFNNIDPTVALDKLRAGLAGEAEPLRALGVFLSEARVQQEAYRLGIAETGDELTEAQKVQARYSLILADTSKAQGDFARTSDSLANSQRRIRAVAEDVVAGLAGKVLPTIANVADSFASFIGDFQKAKGAEAKFDVAVSGLENLGRDVFESVREQIGSVDWPEAFATARAEVLEGIRSLGEFVGEIDFGEVGRTVAELLVDALRQTGAFLSSVDWEIVGGAIVKGIKDFLVAVDWIGLAKGVILLLVAALSGVGDLLKGAGIALGRAVIDGISEGIDRAKDFVLRGLLSFVEDVLGVTSFLGRFDPFKDLRASVQERLRQMENDTARSMGNVQKSIDGVEGKSVTVTIDTVVTGEGPGAGETVQGDRAASAAAKRINGQISGFIDRWRKAAQDAVAKAEARVEDAKKAFPKLIESLQLDLDEASVTAGFGDDLAVLGRIEAAILNQIRIEGETADLARDLFEIRQKRAAAIEAQAQAASDAFRDAIGAIQLRVDQAEATAGLQDDLARNTELQNAIRSRIRVEGQTTELLSMLFQAQEKRKQIEKQMRENQRAEMQRDQFRALGLTGEGDKPTPTISNLQKQLGSLEQSVKGTPLDTAATRSLMERARKVLAGQWGKATEETRAKIRDFFAEIRGELRNGERDGGPLTATKALDTSAIVKGLGLDPAEAAEIRSRLSGFNTGGVALAGGTVPRSSSTAGGPAAPGTQSFQFDLFIDGQAVDAVVVPRVQKRNNRTPALSRGRSAGRSGL